MNYTHATVRTTLDLFSNATSAQGFIPTNDGVNNIVCNDINKSTVFDITRDEQYQGSWETEISWTCFPVFT